MDLAVRFAVMLGSRIFVPAASFYENETARAVLLPFLQSEVGDLFKFVGSGTSLEEFCYEKADQYRVGSKQQAIYASSLKQLAGWERRKRSATSDIGVAWRARVVEGTVLSDFHRFRAGEMSDDTFATAWDDVPGKLGREAFIVSHVLELLPIYNKNLAAENELHRIINHDYFKSYATDFGAAVIQNLSALGGDEVPSGRPSEDIDYGSLLKILRSAGLLERVRRSSPEELEQLPFDPSYEEAIVMSQTEGFAEKLETVAPEIIPVDLAIVTALPKEREAVEAVFGPSTNLRVPNDPHIYKQINLQVEGQPKRIVVATLSEMGNARAGITSTDMLRSFSPAFIIMIGIAGGMPKPTTPELHVRLGDVVIAQSILEYDHVKRKQNGDPEVRDTAQRISNMINQLVNANRNQRDGFDIGWLAVRDRTLRAYGLDPEKLPPDVLHDLDGSVIQHPEDPRRQRSPSIVHFGRIGAGDTLLKDPVVRDWLRDNHAVMAVDMESAGLRDAGWSRNSEFGVIRGVVDYCDDFKDDRWHMVSAISAAALARFLFEQHVQMHVG